MKKKMELRIQETGVGKKGDRIQETGVGNIMRFIEEIINLN